MFRWFALFITCSALLVSRGWAVLDVQPADGVPDIWALFYEAGALAPDEDTDGDGMSNAVEAAAGTNPFQPGSLVKITALTRDEGGVHLTFPTLIGKRYQVRSSPTVAGAIWTNRGTALAGNGDALTTTVDEPGTEHYFQVLVLDADSDGDGVTDWEEITAGFDPNSSHSNGSGGPDDLAALTAALRAPNVITITATPQSIAEPAGNGGSAQSAELLVRRSGGLGPIVVNLSVNGSAGAGTDFAPLPGSVALAMGRHTALLAVTPLADTLVESPEAVLVSVAAGNGYSTGSPGAAAVLIEDYTQPNGDGIFVQYFNNTSASVPDFSVAPALSRVEPQINGNWPGAINGGSPGPGVNGDQFASRWRAEVLPEFAQIYTFYANVNTGGRLRVNGQLLVNNWGATATNGEFSGTIALQAGRRYALEFEHFERTGDSYAMVSWQSANQPKQLIPQARLFSNAPPQILSATEVLLLQNSGPYSYQIVASGNPGSYSAANLPPGWTFNAATGLINGSPEQAGSWDILLTATNSFGSGSAILKLEVIATGGAITRELWSGAAGDTVAQIPLSLPPTSSSPIPALEGPQDADDNYGARIRGTITAPLTGVYKFWITADHAAELWISDDSEAINAFKRAEVIAPTAHRGWTEAGAGKSSLLWLDAGQKYYVEVLHKESTGADHVSVGWLKPGEGGADPGGVLAPSEVVPGYALSPYVPPGPANGESLLFTANLTAQSGAVTSGYGSSSLQLSADESEAILRFSYANLSTPVVSKHVHVDAWNGHPQGEIIFDIDDAAPRADGSFVWPIEPVGTFLTSAEVVNAIKAGVAYINVHTVNYPAGEIRGNYRLQAGSTTFVPPGPPPAWTPDHTNPNAAARFLVQSTFGVHGADSNASGLPDAIEQVQALGYEGWIDQQIGLPPTAHYPYVFTNRNLTSPNGSTYPGNLIFNSWWKNAVTAPDQLRQRLAFALSEILVVSEAGPLDDRAETLADFYDTLLSYSLGDTAVIPGPNTPPADGNFFNLLKAVTLHPAMGRYLDMLNNDKPSLTTGRIPNENYAREILQLFSIGLNRMWPDGSLMLNSKGEPIPTYDQNAIIGFAHVFTGWGYNYAGGYRTTFTGTANWLDPMREVPSRHFTGQKRLLNNVVLRGLPTIGGLPLDPYATHTAAQYNTPAYQMLAAEELEAAHQQIFDHPNTGPFICRQLIQRLVTSTPSRGYIYRVSEKFRDNGLGIRGDLKAVVKAILLDYEARSPQLLTQQGYGKQREPLVRVTAVARAFPAPGGFGGTYTQTGNLITITLTPAQPLVNGSNVYLEFSGGAPSDPDDAPYTVSGVTTVGGSTTFTVRPLSTENSATYSAANATLTVTVPNEHSFNTGANNQVYLQFLTGTPTAPADGVFTVTSVTSNEINFTVPAPLARRATYSQSGNNITLTVPEGHTYAPGSLVRIDFVTGSSGTAVSGEYTVASVNGLQLTIDYPTDAVTRTGNAHIILPAEIVARSGTLTATRAAYAVDRSGNVSATLSDWNMDNTDTDLNQTPLRAPTVFNFFEPDYSFPGPLAQAGLITPEFQITSDTSVMRQANFLYNGIFNDLQNTQGLASFKSGARDVAIDFRPWMANGPGNVPWTNDANLNALIDRLNTLLLAGQLPSTGTNNYSSNPRVIVNAKQVIYDYVRNTANIAYSNAAPTTAQRRDRIRAIVHLLVSSPDFTIQK